MIGNIFSGTTIKFPELTLGATAGLAGDSLVPVGTTPLLIDDLDILKHLIWPNFVWCSTLKFKLIFFTVVWHKFVESGCWSCSVTLSQKRRRENILLIFDFPVFQ